MLRDDSAMNFSPEHFDEFIKPYDQQLLSRFGGGVIHFCGRGDHYISRLAGMQGVYAVNSSQPHLNEMETVLAHTVDRGIALLGLDRQVALQALARGRALRGLVQCF
jgi:uroporphyrinogen-III decarboxylase